LETHLRVVSLGHRKKIIKNLYLLKVLWISMNNADAHGLNFSEKSSIMGGGLLENSNMLEPDGVGGVMITDQSSI